MKFIDVIAAVVLFLQLPIPLYWFVLHPAVNFWRTRSRAAYVVGLAASWLPMTAALIVFRRHIFRQDWPPVWRIVVGLALIALEIWIIRRVSLDLGGARLVGATELGGGGEIAQNGIYGRMRHPRYVGSFLAIIGALLMAGTQASWVLAAVWAVLMRIAIAFEGREMRARFGRAYEAYCRRVPGFFPRIT